MTTATATSPIDSGVLLEAGTNEVEMLVFCVGKQRCGVNVAKVREVRPVEKVTHLPQYPGAVRGVVRIREAVVPLVDLRKHLWGDEDDMEPETQQTDLLLEFNNRLVAFRVQAIERVFRISWKDFIPLPQCPGMTAPVTGVLLLEGGIVSVLDFESIGAVLGVNRDVSVFQSAPGGAPARRTERGLVYVDDSQLIRKMLGDALSRAGYSNIRGFADGQEAWEHLIRVAEETPAEKISEKIGCVISDIEMPRMDGFNLTKQIRGHAVLKDLPVVLFSSLVSKDNEKKGRQVGATAQVSKPKWEDLATTLTELLGQVLA